MQIWNISRIVVTVITEEKEGSLLMKTASGLAGKFLETSNDLFFPTEVDELDTISVSIEIGGNHVGCLIDGGHLEQLIK